MTAQEFYQISEGEHVLIDGTKHECTSNTGFMVHDRRNLRFESLECDPRLKGGQEHSYYISEQGTQEWLDQHRIEITQKEEVVQLSLF